MLKSGKIGVKGGWRLYSSGPGIYIRQVIQNILGIRLTADTLSLDPVLPAEADGLRLRYDCFGRTVTFRFHTNAENAPGQRVRIADGSAELSAQTAHNPYRPGAAVLSRGGQPPSANAKTVKLRASKRERISAAARRYSSTTTC